MKNIFFGGGGGGGGGTWNCSRELRKECLKLDSNGTEIISQDTDGTSDEICPGSKDEHNPNNFRKQKLGNPV